MNLENATEADLAEILQLQKKAFHGPALIYDDFNLPPLIQTIEDLKTEFKLKTFYKIIQDGQIIASIRCFIRDNVLFCEKLIVDPAFQNRGIGTSLMILIENKYADSVARYALLTGHKSERNLHLYTKLGYQEIGQEKISDDLKLIYLEKSNEIRTA